MTIHEVFPNHMKFSLSQLKELEMIDKIRDKVMQMREELMT